MANSTEHLCSRCYFGGRSYTLEDSWHPDLGEPFGIMHCVVCTCEPQRNRRGKPAGKVSCKNIKHSCPKLPCADPIALPGQCCKSCPKAPANTLEKKSGQQLFDKIEYFQERENGLHRNYNDRAYFSSEDLIRDNSQIDFVALLIGGSDPRGAATSAVAKAKFTFTHLHLIFSINYERLSQPIRVRFSEPDGTVLFEHPVQQGTVFQDGMICGMWRNLQKASIRMLKVDQMRITLITQTHPAGQVQGQIVKHRALFAESDRIPLRVQILHQDSVLRRVLANVTLQIQVDGTGSEVIGVTLETKPRRRNKRSILYDMTHSYKDGMAQGVVKDLDAEFLRHLAQGTAFLQVSTKANPQGEIRGK
ncbi:chordin [Crotalus adamanteus]|uniref:Chordin n=1 Tax=Crotalus adamanteus TaxID=8729 RepID=A0AAW1BGN2_CROAD